MIRIAICYPRNGLIVGLVMLVGLLGVAPTAAAVERHVNPRHPAAQDAGGGSANRPYRTIGFAMRQLLPGDHLIIAAGVYRETLRFPEHPSWDAARPTIVEGKGQVLIKASDVVEDWKPLGQGRFVKAWPRETAQVFVDGVPLQQVGGSLFGQAGASDRWPGRLAGDRESMPEQSFFYDLAQGELHLRVNAGSLNNRVVEVSVRSQAMQGRNLNRVAVRNLEFQHGNASPFDRSALVSMAGDRIWLDRIRVSHCDAVGIELTGDDNTLSDSSANYCGQLGLRARGIRMLLERNETSYNNTRGFDKWWEAGGAKFVGGGGLRESRLTHHRAIGNLGDGIWYDWNNRSNRIEHSIAAHNSGFGIHYEASSGGIIANNVVVGNRQRGIYLLHSSDSVIAFNLVAGNGLQGIAVVDEGRRDPGFNMKPVNNSIFGNLLAWNKGALVLPDRSGSSRSDANLFIGTPEESHARWGWRGSLQNIGDWMAQSGQDSSSAYLEFVARPMGSESVGMQPGEPWLSWFKTFRPTSPALAVNPGWLKLLPEPPRNLRAGPTIEGGVSAPVKPWSKFKAPIRS